MLQHMHKEKVRFADYKWYTFGASFKPFNRFLYHKNKWNIL